MAEQQKDIDFHCPKCGLKMKQSDVTVELKAFCQDKFLSNNVMIAVTRPPMLAFGCFKCKVSLVVTPKIEVPEKKIITAH